jgi:hypothetical protein
MSLETDIRQEVRSWDINVSRIKKPVLYADLIEPILYGISVGVTETLLAKMEPGNSPDSPTHILDMRYKDAIESFQKEYLIQKFEENEFDEVRTAHAIGIGGSPASARANLNRRTQRLFGTKPSKMKDIDKHEHLQPDEISDEELERIGVSEIKRYGELLTRSLFRNLIEKNAEKISKKLLSFVKSRFHKPYQPSFSEMKEKEALLNFRKWYLTEQLNRGGTTAKAAELSGLDSDTIFRARLRNVNSLLDA